MMYNGIYERLEVIFIKNKPNFSNIETYSHLVEKNEFFLQYTNHKIPKQYDANFILLEYSPTLPEFQLIETMHQNYQLEINQEHLHFYWPEDTGMHIDIIEYLNEREYEIGMLELMCITPKNYSAPNTIPEIEIKEVTEETLKDFIQINYTEDLTVGVDYAKQQEAVYHYQYHLPNVTFLLASLGDKPVGSLILISSADYLEIDNVLTVTVFRNTGVASSIITHVIDKANVNNQDVILVADAEDTPKEMYKKMGFQTISTQIHARKILDK